MHVIAPVPGRALRIPQATMAPPYSLTVVSCLNRRFLLASFGQPSTAGYHHCMMPAVPESHGRALDKSVFMSSVDMCYLSSFLGESVVLGPGGRVRGSECVVMCLSKKSKCSIYSSPGII